MKNKYKYPPVKNYALVADGLEEREARELNASNSKMRKERQENDSLKAKETEFRNFSFSWNTQVSLRNIFGATRRVNSRMEKNKNLFNRALLDAFAMKNVA